MPRAACRGTGGVRDLGIDRPQTPKFTGAEIDLSEVECDRVDALLYGEAHGRISSPPAKPSPGPPWIARNYWRTGATTYTVTGNEQLCIEVGENNLNWELPALHDVWWNNRARHGTMSESHPKHYCGVFGVYTLERRRIDVLRAVRVAASRPGERRHRDLCRRAVQGAQGNGLVPQVFKGKALESLRGNMAIGHTRYSTTGHRRTSAIPSRSVDCAKARSPSRTTGTLPTPPSCGRNWNWTDRFFKPQSTAKSFCT